MVGAGVAAGAGGAAAGSAAGQIGAAAIQESGDLAEQAMQQAGMGLGGVGAGLGAALAAMVNEVSQTITAVDGRTILDIDFKDGANLIYDEILGGQPFKSPMRLRLSLLSMMGLGFVFLLFMRTRQHIQAFPLSPSLGYSKALENYKYYVRDFIEIIPSVPPNALNFGNLDFPNVTLLGPGALGGLGGEKWAPEPRRWPEGDAAARRMNEPFMQDVPGRDYGNITPAMAQVILDNPTWTLPGGVYSGVSKAELEAKAAQA